MRQAQERPIGNGAAGGRWNYMPHRLEFAALQELDPLAQLAPDLLGRRGGEGLQKAMRRRREPRSPAEPWAPGVVPPAPPRSRRPRRSRSSCGRRRPRSSRGRLAPAFVRPVSRRASRSERKVMNHASAGRHLLLLWRLEGLPRLEVPPAPIRGGDVSGAWEDAPRGDLPRFGERTCQPGGACRSAHGERPVGQGSSRAVGL